MQFLNCKNNILLSIDARLYSLVELRYVEYTYPDSHFVQKET